MKKIELLHLERDVDAVIDDLLPAVGLELVISNNTDFDILFRDRDGYRSRFIGFTPLMGSDTMFFINLFDDINVIPHKQEIEYTTSLSYPILRFIDESKFDNTELILNLIKEMKFYYVPISMDDITVGQDTVVLKNQYRIRVDSNTKVTSYSIIR